MGRQGTAHDHYFLTFEEAFNRFPGFSYEVQGVFQEIVDGRKTFFTYVVKDEQPARQDDSLGIKRR